MKVSSYAQAVELAKSGDEKGFEYLYEKTYQSKYYLALQYMKNEESAKDVLQEAYIKAFSKLDKLEQPEAFSGWLGVIVANTAKNMLTKKNPMLFSDLSEQNEDQNAAYEIEDDLIQNQPELAYTQKEMQDLVRELIDSLSEEQRMCILMFHMEGASIREIASALGCSENTVKSRLNYGRKNLKAKAEALQKKGYKLFNISPVALLLYLLRTQQADFSSSPFAQSIGKAMAENIFHSKEFSHLTAASASEKAANGGIHLAAQAAKHGVFHSAAVKIAAVVFGVCIVGGAAVYGFTQVRTDDTSQPQTSQQQTSDTPQEQPKQVQDEEYTSLIAGNLTKEELEFVLAYGPKEIPSQGFTYDDYKSLLICLCDASARNGNFIQSYNTTDDLGREAYSVETINRFFSSFTDFRFDADSISADASVRLDGDQFYLLNASIDFVAHAEITSAQYTSDKMEIYFTYDYLSSDMGQQGKPKEVTNKIATLTPNADGLFQIIKIEPADTQTDTASSEANTSDGQTVKELYTQILQKVANQESGYEFSKVSTSTQGYDYFLYDVNGDGQKELVVGALFSERTSTYHDFRVYGYEKQEKGYQIKPFSGEAVAESLYAAADQNGFYQMDFARGTGQIKMYRITFQNDQISISTNSEYEFTLGDDASNSFLNDNPLIEWKSSSDLSGFNVLDSEN
jgi:RNA polymerase sigma factor (sigma-70 family)